MNTTLKALATVLLHASATAAAITQTEATSSAYTAEIENKLIGRIAYALVFEPWVREQVITGHDFDEHACRFEFKSGQPWEDKNIVAPAQHISHNCAASLVTTLYITTTVPSVGLTRQALDTDQEEITESTGSTIVSKLTVPKLAADRVDAPGTAGSQDAWHFQVNDAFDQETSSWAYSYRFVLQGESDIVYRELELFANDGSASADYTTANAEEDAVDITRHVLPISYLQSCGTDSPPSIKQVTVGETRRVVWAEVTFTCSGVEDVVISMEGSTGKDSGTPSTVQITGEVNTIDRLTSIRRPDATSNLFRTNGFTFGGDVIASNDPNTADEDTFTFTNTLQENEFWCGFNTYTGTQLKTFVPIACKWP